MMFSQQVYRAGLPFPPPVDHILSELSTMTHLSWVALHSMAHSFIALCKPLHHDKAVIMKPFNLKGNQPWMLIRRTGAEAETPVFWSSDVNSWLTGKVSVAGKDWGQRRRVCQRMRWVDGITDVMDMNLGKLWEMVRDREAWCPAVHEITKSQTWLGDWKTTMIYTLMLTV